MGKPRLPCPARTDTAALAAVEKPVLVFELGFRFTEAFITRRAGQDADDPRVLHCPRLPLLLRRQYRLAVVVQAPGELVAKVLRHRVERLPKPSGIDGHVIID